MTLASFSTPLVSTEWLADHLADPRVKVIDATWHMPSTGRDARKEYETAHIPGAVFCDIGWISDQVSPLPHTLPGSAFFAERVSSLGISSNDLVVVYDSSGQNFSAPRVWWLFRAFGHSQVAVLDGGLKKWKAEGRATSAEIPDPTPAEFQAKLVPERVRDISAMKANLSAPSEQVVDARSPGRFAGTEPEPRAGVRSGHIPGSVNVHYARLVQEDGTMRSPEALREILRAAGLDLARPIVATCGSGVTACSVLLALDRIDATEIAVYDGSWTEWGGDTDTPVQTGA